MDQNLLERVMHEVFQRCITLVSLRAEQGSLPAIEHKAGEFLRPEGIWQVSLLDSFLQHGSDGSLPTCEIRTEAALQERTCS